MPRLRSLLVHSSLGAVMAVAYLSDASAFQTLSTATVDAALPGPPGAPHYALIGNIPGAGNKELVTSAIPFDKTYAELTAEQKTALRDQFPVLPQDAEPPFPASGQKNLASTLVDISHRLASPTSFEAFVNVDSTGKPSSINIVQSPDPTLTQLVGMALLKQTYKPATCQGQPCEMSYPVRLNFAAGAGSLGERYDASVRLKPEFRHPNSDPKNPSTTR